jgi:pilus assembly protein CpaB
MLLRRVLLPGLALLLAGGAAIFARGWLEEQRRPVGTEAAGPAINLKQVLVAAEDLQVGRFLEPEAMRWQDWPDVSLPSSYIVDGAGDMEELAGAVLRVAVAAGQPIARNAVVKPGDRGFLAAVLDPGMRAVSVPVDEASSNAGLIFPGDRVDLILSQSLGSGEGRESTRRVSETVLENVRVIAMGRNLRGDPAESSGPAVSQIRTTTLEVTPEGAEKVALVTELGKLSLSLRSLARSDDGKAADGPPMADGRITWDSDVARVLRPENQPVSTMALIRGRESNLIALPKGALQ